MYNYFDYVLSQCRSQSIKLICEVVPTRRELIDKAAKEFTSTRRTILTSGTITSQNSGTLKERYAVFALLDSGELVNVGNFDDLDTAEISQIILDIFTEDKKAVFDVNLEVFGIKKFLEMPRYVSADSETLYQTLVSDLKRQLKSGELDVSFT